LFAQTVDNDPPSGEMSISFVIPARGPLPQEKICIARQSAEMLWPMKAMFDNAFGDTSRQYLSVLDQSVVPITRIYEDMFGVVAPKLAVAGICED